MDAAHQKRMNVKHLGWIDGGVKFHIYNVKPFKMGEDGVIDLTGVTVAELSFAMALDLDGGDSVTVNIIDDTSDTVIAADILPITDGDINNAFWQSVGPVAIPAPALGQPVRIEWCLSGTGGLGADFMGWYLDDVVVTDNSP